MVGKKKGESNVNMVRFRKINLGRYDEGAVQIGKRFCKLSVDGNDLWLRFRVGNWLIYVWQKVRSGYGLGMKGINEAFS